MHNNHHTSAAAQDELQVLRQRIAELELERVAYQQELSALREEVIHAGEVWLKAIFDNAAVGIGLTDRTGNVIAFNTHGARQLGYTAEELLGLNLMQLTHPDDRAITVAHIQQLLRGEINSYRIEKRFIRKDGGVFWADLSVTAVRNIAGQIEFLVGVVVDITERKQAEEALYQSENRFRMLAENARDIVFRCRYQPFYHVEYISPSVTTILGYLPEEYYADPNFAFRVIHPDSQAEHERILQTLAIPPDDPICICYVARDGRPVWLEAYVRVTMDTEGKPLIIDGIARDVTERKQAERALQHQQQFLRRIIDSNPAIICARDRAGRFTLVNQTLADMYGTTVEALLGKTDAEMQLDASEVAQIRQQDQQVLDSGTDLIIPERRIVDVHGQTHYVSIIKRPLYMSDGTADQVLVVATDITTRKLAEEQLQSLNEQLQQHAIHDALTGLYNRRYLNETLPRELLYAERHRQAIGVLMLDIDHFKYINDTYGHDAGDALLRAIGAFLRNNIRSTDIACRYGGEEFTLVLVGTSLYDAWQRAEDIRAGVKTLVVQHQCYILNTITASVGVAVFPDHSLTAEGLLKAADRALYQAKRSGRDRVVVATDVPFVNSSDGSL